MGFQKNHVLLLLPRHRPGSARGSPCLFPKYLRERMDLRAQVEQYHEHGTVCKQSDWSACHQLGCLRDNPWFCSWQRWFPQEAEATSNPLTTIPLLQSVSAAEPIQQRPPRKTFSDSMLKLIILTNLQE